MYQPNQPDYRRLFVAIFLAAMVLTLWQVFVEWPRRQQLALFQAEQAKELAAKQTLYAKSLHAGSKEAEKKIVTREEGISASPRLQISSAKLHGSIALKGAKFDDLTLAKYRETLDKASREVSLFSPAGNDLTYMAQVGWIAPDDKTIVPGPETLWQADKKQLTPTSPVTLSWNNGQNIIFKLNISLDEDYMFIIRQSVENRSGSVINVVPYGFINRAYHSSEQANMILHEGPMGVIEGAIKEIHYKEIRENGNQNYDTSNGWFGITDKYWLSALIPTDDAFKTTYSYYQKGGIDRYQVDYVSQAQAIENAATATYNVRLFAGAKEIDALDRYATGDAEHKPVPLFDRAVDFGMLYFLTKPLFLLLNFFYKLVGNFGVAIMLLTIVVKLCMFPLANKSFKSISQMRKLQPEMTKLKEKHGDDRINFQKELMAFYRQEKVNPAAGCLPIIIQMPVFFALYKVLFVTIEMRHAPFFGWLKDLSAQDPSNLFTAFGLMPWHMPSWLHLGILPILMCVTMVIQMRQQPQPADPVQAKVIKFMPFFFLFMFASFPAGLVLYWTWSNFLSILQQAFISKRHGDKK